MTPAIVIGLIWAVLLILIDWTFGQSAADENTAADETRKSGMPRCAPSPRISTYSSGSSNVSLERLNSRI
jgi:hypothetical protein